jgi:hypothetical protein
VVNVFAIFILVLLLQGLGMHRVIFHLVFFSLTFFSSVSSAESVCSDQILASPIKGGFSWTLPSRLGQILSEAESLYGERDKSWTLLGVEFVSNDQPAIWYPFSHEDKKYLLVQLTKKALEDEQEALLQLSHEAVHLLSPAGGGKNTNVFEEGLATYFSIEYLKKQGFKVDQQILASKKYREAFELVKQVAESHTNFNEMIELIRLEHEGFATLKADDIPVYFKQVDRGLAERLVAEF